MAEIDTVWDFVVVGGGVIGLTVAYELQVRYRNASILLLEKEQKVGLHSSGRNSGVLHSGIYYKPGTLKAQMCAQGQREWINYCKEHGLPYYMAGKVITATRPEDDVAMTTLINNAKANGVTCHVLTRQQLAKVEPNAATATESALLLPGTSVIDPHILMDHLAIQVRKKGVFIHHRPFRVYRGEAQTSTVFNDGEFFSGIKYKHLVNCAGLHADVIARQLGYDASVEMLPIRGTYYLLDRENAPKVMHLLYPVPDLEMPFLGVHFTNTVYNQTYVGPTAIPTFGRESYSGFFTNPVEAARILWRLGTMFVQNKHNFRRYATEEGGKLFKSRFLKHAQRMVPKLQAKHLLYTKKCGIRPQLVDTKTGEMVTDMLVVTEGRHTHVLNAISPAFTCAWPFARFVIEKIEAK